MKITTGAKGVVVLARGPMTGKFYVVVNGKIYYDGKDQLRANKVYNVLSEGMKIDENMVR